MTNTLGDVLCKVKVQFSSKNIPQSKVIPGILGLLLVHLTACGSGDPDVKNTDTLGNPSSSDAQKNSALEQSLQKLKECEAKLNDQPDRFYIDSSSLSLKQKWTEYSVLPQEDLNEIKNIEKLIDECLLQSDSTLKLIASSDTSASSEYEKKEIKLKIKHAQNAKIYFELRREVHQVALAEAELSTLGLDLNNGYERVSIDGKKSYFHNAENLDETKIKEIKDLIEKTNAITQQAQALVDKKEWNEIFQEKPQYNRAFSQTKVVAENGKKISKFLSLRVNSEVLEMIQMITDLNNKGIVLKIREDSLSWYPSKTGDLNNLNTLTDENKALLKQCLEILNQLNTLYKNHLSELNQILSFTDNDFNDFINDREKSIQVAIDHLKKATQ